MNKQNTETCLARLIEDIPSDFGGIINTGRVFDVFVPPVKPGLFLTKNLDALYIYSDKFIFLEE